MRSPPAIRFPIAPRFHGLPGFVAPGPRSWPAIFRPCRGTRPPVTPTQACRWTKADGPGVAWPARGPRTASEDPPATRDPETKNAVAGDTKAGTTCSIRMRPLQAACYRAAYPGYVVAHRILVSHIRTFRCLPLSKQNKILEKMI